MLHTAKSQTPGSAEALSRLQHGACLWPQQADSLAELIIRPRTLRLSQVLETISATPAPTGKDGTQGEGFVPGPPLL